MDVPQALLRTAANQLQSARIPARFTSSVRYTPLPGPAPYIKVKPLLGFLATLLLSCSTISAHALTTYASSGSFSSMAGAYTIDFGVSPINNTGVVSGSLPAGTVGGVQYSYSGGGLFNYSAPPSTLANGISARPVGSTDNYWSVGSSPAAQRGPGVVTFASGVGYFGFLWGSPDAYNKLSFYDGNQLLGTFDGSAVLVPPNGNQAFSKYFNILAGPGEKITKIIFASATNAFETDNHAFVSSVPEPEIYAMMAAGLGLVSFVARRRSRQTREQPAAA